MYVFCFQQRYFEKQKGVDALQKEVQVVGKFIHKVLELCVTKGVNFAFQLEAVDFDLTWAQVLKQMKLTKLEYDLAQEQRIHTENILIRVIDSINTVS